ncbi:nucleolar complex protein 4 homolog [Dermacentor andersoni]|uniref:nucleolar complex protein 4 homolog n=1 Tax=Dermacentor andersoni TaxID=34620 RepID=UPI00215532C4|nr:nucleolar complex protein 4 homolog [Dermacentor andersoni]
MAKRKRGKNSRSAASKVNNGSYTEDAYISDAVEHPSPSEDTLAEGKTTHDSVGKTDINSVVEDERNSDAPEQPRIVQQTVANRKRADLSASEIKKNAALIVQDRKNVNLLLDIVDCLSSDSEDVVVAAAQAANKVFCHFLKTSAALYESEAAKPAESQNALEKFNAWLRQRYADAWRSVVAMLSGASSSGRVQSLALQVAMKWIEVETVHKKQGEHHVPSAKVAAVVEALLDPERDMKSVISKFNQFLDLADVKTYALRALGKVARTWRRIDAQTATKQDGDEDKATSKEEEEEEVKASQSTKKPEMTDRYLSNLYNLLLGFDMTAEPHKPGEPVPVLGGESTNYIVNHEQEVKRLSAVWITFLRQKLPVKLYRELLILLPDKVVPYMHNPLLVTDFFIESYNRGGSYSLLALNGLFLLIHRYHLDYPNFYEKLYALLEPGVFYEKYRARFFFLTDLFLSSSHLPAYLVASFAKKLARMALAAPPYALLYVIPFIGNLLIRHRSLVTMINDSSDRDASIDPYEAEQMDPSKSQAVDSSLWELKTLQSHWYPTVAKKAKFIDDNLPRMEWDFSERLEEGYAEMMKRAKSAKHKEAPTNFHKVEGLLKQKEELLSELWTLE